MKLIDWAIRNTLGLCSYYELEKTVVPHKARAGFWGFLEHTETSLIFTHKCNYPDTNVKHIIESTDYFCTKADWARCPLNKKEEE